MHFDLDAVGFIPVHTGEPDRARAFLSLDRVYPRAYGGAGAAF